MFLAEDLSEGEPDFDDSEELQIRRLPFRQALDMAMSGDISDVLSVTGLLKLGALRPKLLPK